MSKRYLTATLLAMIAAAIEAQVERQADPRLVVNITVDQLLSDYMETLQPYFGEDGFRRLMEQGTVYQNVSFPYLPVDRASAIATMMTGTTPFYHGIIGNRWLNRKTAQPMSCTDDGEQNGIYTLERASARHILTSTITDELKVSTKGRALVYSLARQRDAAILSAGHAADGAFWKDPYKGSWCSSTYYMPSGPDWLAQYNTSPALKKKKKTEEDEWKELTDLALLTIDRTGMGQDDVPDMLCITLDATTRIDKKRKTTWEEEVRRTYVSVDRQLASLITGIEQRVGAGRVMFVVTSTGYADEPQEELSRYRIPTGTVYINRTASLLNLYLGALYGSDRYVDGCTRNQIYINTAEVEQKRLRLNEILSLAQSFLLQCEGIRNAYTLQGLMATGGTDTERVLGGMNATVGGQIVVDVAPGWQLVNEDTQESYHIDARPARFPLIVYRQGEEPRRISTPVTADRIAPTIAHSIHIRAPNACTAEVLP